MAWHLTPDNLDTAKTISSSVLALMHFWLIRKRNSQVCRSIFGNFLVSKEPNGPFTATASTLYLGTSELKRMFNQKVYCIKSFLDTSSSINFAKIWALTLT